MAIWRRGAALMLMLALTGGLAARDEPDPPNDGDEPDVTTGKLGLTVNVGGHSGPIGDMVFGKDGKTLYTAGPPGEVHEWDAETGERRRVWRFPQQVVTIALSPDGKQLAVSGIHRKLETGKIETPLWFVDVPSGKAFCTTLAKGKAASKAVNALAFSPDGKLLAVAGGKSMHLIRADTAKAVQKFDKSAKMISLAFDPSTGRRLVMTRASSKEKLAPMRLLTIDLKGKSTRAQPVRDAGVAWPRAAWSPDGKRIVCISGGDKPTLQVWAAAVRLLDAPDWSLDLGAMITLAGKAREQAWTTVGVAFVGSSSKELLTCWHQADLLRLIRVDLDRKEATLLAGTVPLQSSITGRVAVSRDGRRLAATTNPAHRFVLFDVGSAKPTSVAKGRKAKEDEQFGPSLNRPRTVRWSTDGDSIVWGYKADGAYKYTRGLNLPKLELVDRVDPKETYTSPPPDGWSFTRDDSQRVVFRRVGVNTPLGLKDARPKGAQVYGEGKRRRLLIKYLDGARIAVIDTRDGKYLHSIGKEPFGSVLDMAVSPNGKYLAVAGGDLPLKIFSLDNPDEPLLQVLHHRGDWVAWTPEGYYAGTPGGEKLIGWKVATDLNQVAEFYPIERFRKTFRKPELIKGLLAAGSVQAALKAAGAGEAKVDDQLPPTVNILDARAPDPANPRKYIIKAEATPGSDKQPIEGMRLWLDGKLLPDKPKTLARSTSGKSSVAEWVLEMPEGKSELKVIARCQDVNGISPSRSVEVAGKPKAQPKLHVVSIGLNYAHDKDLKLNCAVNDATAVATAFPNACVGATHHFKEKAAPIVLLDDKATAKAITDVLAKLKKDVKRHDLVVFFYAGHGEREKDEFYLLTAGARTGDLKGTALSGTALREALKEVQGQVLLVLDACHSGHAGKALRGASAVADEASRSLADEECAVTLLAAAMSHERALEEKGGKHGFFTEALLDALRRAEKVAHNRHDGQQYVHHLAADVLDDVQHRSGDRQHPFLSIPWTIEPYPIRRVAQTRAGNP